MFEAVAKAMYDVRMRCGANPSSQHEPGRRARRELEQARDRICEILGAKTKGTDTDRLIFTSGGTESNTIALRGLAPHIGSRIIISAIEHPSIEATAQRLASLGWQIDKIRVGPEGTIDLGHAQELLATSPRPALVSVMLGNNETGVIQPVRELTSLCSAKKIPIHTDAVQAIGKVEVDFRDLGVTAMSLAPHKFHGPLGLGGLLISGGTNPEPQFFGGFQQAGFRPGTESVELAVGARVALEAWHEERAERTKRISTLRDRLEQGVAQIEPRMQVIGAESQRLPHVSCMAFRGLDRQSLAMALDLAGVACSTGSACASGSSEPSPVLLAMGLADDVISGAIRLSLGAQTTAQEIDFAVEKIGLVCRGFPPL